MRCNLVAYELLNINVNVSCFQDTSGLKDIKKPISATYKGFYNYRKTGGSLMVLGIPGWI